MFFHRQFRRFTVAREIGRELREWPPRNYSLSTSPLVNFDARGRAADIRVHRRALHFPIVGQTKYVDLVSGGTVRACRNLHIGDEYSTTLAAAYFSNGFPRHPAGKLPHLPANAWKICCS